MGKTISVEEVDDGFVIDFQDSHLTTTKTIAINFDDMVKKIKRFFEK